MIEPVGRIWKCEPYEINNGALSPTARAQSKAYDPWRFHREPKKERWALITPYGELLEVARALKISPPSSKLTPEGKSEWQLSGSVATDVIAWCTEYGLLGILPLSLELLAANVHVSFDDVLLSKSCDSQKPASSSTFAAAFSVAFRDLWPTDSESVRPERTQDTDLVTWTIRERKTHKHRLWSRFFLATFEHQTSSPSKGEYWLKYSEPIELFTVFAWRFLEAVAAVTGMTVLVSKDSVLADANVAASYLTLLANQSSVRFERDVAGKQWREVYGAPSLLSQLAAMFLSDWQAGKRVAQCQECTAIFISEDSRAKYCSLRCRKTMVMRNYRARAQDGTKASGSEKKHPPAPSSKRGLQPR